MTPYFLLLQEEVNQYRFYYKRIYSGLLSMETSLKMASLTKMNKLCVTERLAA